MPTLPVGDAAAILGNGISLAEMNEGVTIRQASAALGGVITFEQVMAGRKQTEIERENTWRREAVDSLLWAFYMLNGAVILFLFFVRVGEVNSPSGPHVITEKLTMRLIEASAIQLGALAFAVGRSLAKKQEQEVLF